MREHALDALQCGIPPSDCKSIEDSAGGRAEISVRDVHRLCNNTILEHVLHRYFRIGLQVG